MDVGDTLLWTVGFLVLGYVCPLVIVFVSFLTNGGGAEGQYFSRDTCWLVYNGLMKGSIYCFLIPVGIIVFVNVFSMLVVIVKLLNHPSTEKVHVKEKMAAKTIMRSVIILTPIFGVTWITGFAVMLLDLTNGPIALAVNYIFVLMNAFQVGSILHVNGHTLIKKKYMNVNTPECIQ
uniref:G-protein coupled receptors family 2 profile 2 domain-containing protein n=1 Tax=Gouania willdenowi TaxID=441366 RepID=A0A8C5G5L5_GOUWI